MAVHPKSETPLKALQRKMKETLRKKGKTYKIF